MPRTPQDPQNAKPSTGPENIGLTIAQAAKQLQCSEPTIRRMIARGELPAYRYGSRIIRIDAADLRKIRRPVTSMAAYREGRTQLAGGAS